MTPQKRNSRLDGKSGENNEAESTDAPERNDEAPGKNSESGYPNDDYWEDTTRDDPKEPPASTPEPETGYRWEPAEEEQSDKPEETDSEK